jgi:hypothetical protein
MCTRCSLKNLKGRDHMEYPGTDKISIKMDYKGNRMTQCGPD